MKTYYIISDSHLFASGDRDHQARRKLGFVATYTRRLKQRLRAAHGRFVRHGPGDHEIWYSPISNRSFPVDGSIKSRHTANAVLGQAGLEKAS